MTKAKDFYSNSVTEAIRQACAEFSTSQEKLDIEVVETGSAGIFGLCKKRAHIRVQRKKSSPPDIQEAVQRSDVGPVRPKPVKNKKDKVSERSAPDSTPAAGKEPKEPAPEPVNDMAVADTSSEQQQFEMPSDEVLASIQIDLDQILKLMGFASTVRVQVEGNGIQCHISGEHEESVAGTEGRTLDNLQYLVRKIASRRLPDKMMVDLDVGDFRERRVSELRERAVELAEMVKADGKTQAIPALNPSERRVVHVALQDDKGVRSRSVGDGIFKKVLIYKPGKGRSPGPKRKGRQRSGPSGQ